MNISHNLNVIIQIKYFSIFFSILVGVLYFSNQFYEYDFNEILHNSDQQELIDKKVLFKTIKFMLKETEDNDPELIKFVRSLVHQPSKKIYNLVNKRKNDFSTFGQSAYVDSILNSKQNGFFIEAGGYTGEEASNTFYFEKERNWSGILIEPIPLNYKKILSKNRKCFVINCCIANKRPIIAKFQIANSMSSRAHQVTENNQIFIEKHRGKDIKRFIYVPCFPLTTILKGLNIHFL
jgi:hypothetical protein